MQLGLSVQAQDCSSTMPPLPHSPNSTSVCSPGSSRGPSLDQAHMGADGLGRRCHLSVDVTNPGRPQSSLPWLSEDTKLRG